MTGTQRWMWTSLLVALVTGASLGVLADRVARAPHDEAPPPARTSTVWFECDEAEDEEARAAHGAKRGKWLDRLSEDLRLDEAQEREIRSLFSEHGERANDFWQRSRNEYCQMRDSLRADVRSVLTDEQIEVLEERIAKRRTEQPARKDGGSGGSQKP